MRCSGERHCSLLQGVNLPTNGIGPARSHFRPRHASSIPTPVFGANSLASPPVVPVKATTLAHRAKLALQRWSEERYRQRQRLTWGSTGWLRSGSAQHHQFLDPGCRV